MITQLLRGIHGEMIYGHQGPFKTKERILQSCWWKGTEKDINEFLEKCDKCHKTKNLSMKQKINSSLSPYVQNPTKGLTWISLDH